MLQAILAVSAIFPMEGRMLSYRSRFLVLFGLLCLAPAGVFGQKNNTRSQDDANQSIKAFTAVYGAVEANFADKVDPEQAIYKGTIPGMLRELDPHSNFMDPKAWAATREDERAQYFGVGMEIGQHSGKTTVIHAFEGSPAYRAGLRPGDAIAAINEDNADALAVNEVASLLRGPRGTKVTITVGRRGISKPLAFDVVRDSIARSCVPQAFWLKPGIAYVSISAFMCETTSRDLEASLKQLGESEINGLILDLRGNPGGLVNEGVDVAGHFLKKNDLVVSLRGRAQPNKNYTATVGNGGHEYPIVVVVNGSSASASEIVTGALQDHDRAWVLGETTFGKGLAQSVFPLSHDTGLALTTAHYYTPSGRLIQRDYTNISFLDYYYHTGGDQKNTSDVKMTDSGRTVYGGGGITPDEKYAPPKLNPFQIAMLRQGSFFDFSASYFGPRADAHLAKGWAPDEGVVDQFHQFLLSSGVKFTEAEFTANYQWVRDQLKREMYITAFSYEQSVRVAIEQDPEIAAAADAMPKAVSLLQNAKKLIVQRFNGQQRFAR